MTQSKFYRIEREEGKDFIEWRDGSGGTVELYDFAVNSKRADGHGSKLLKDMQDNITTHCVYGFTRKSNHNARKFYRNRGFLEIEIPKFYAEKGDEDAIFFYKRK